MAILSIRNSGTPNLSHLSVEINFKYIKGVSIHSIINNMTETMLHHNLDILSAPIVGQNIRLIVVNPRIKLHDIVGDVLINPEIMVTDIYPDLPDWESSMVIPGMEFRIHRPASIGVSFFNSNANRLSAIVTGDNARILLQQIDHLQGLTPLCRVKNPALDVRPSRVLN